MPLFIGVLLFGWPYVAKTSCTFIPLAFWNQCKSSELGNGFLNRCSCDACCGYTGSERGDAAWGGAGSAVHAHCTSRHAVIAM
ncbi:hypothetical protein SAMN02745181_0503 [Rubritalea squalenifaciens DSM 18772]|uniref:Uncharacterized protein n=1 Tax=Rubritalea squalenifaciens DSM 18772 TaxID=1123071 RepID=A0A1M6CKN8_9BACT|nr:hypothetical protein SAMN02745181_0503 [Rubritalea squalenifaciens DSM 18772]